MSTSKLLRDDAKWGNPNFVVMVTAAEVLEMFETKVGGYGLSAGCQMKDMESKIKRLQQQKAELISVIEEVLDSEGGHNVGTLAWFDKVHDMLDRVTGDEE